MTVDPRPGRSPTGARVGGRLTRATGLAAQPPGALPMHAVVLAAAVVVITVGLLRTAVPPALPGGTPFTWLLLVAAVVAVAQLARLRLRIAAGSVNVTWGEAALIIGLYLAPAGWLPAAAFVGAVVAWLLMMVMTRYVTLVDAVHTAASIAVAAAVAGAVTTALTNPLGAHPSPSLALALTLGSLAYLLVTAVLAAVSLSLRHHLPVRALLLRALQGKLLMYVGNVVVGLVVIVILDRDPRWLLALPPALWLLQQTYSHRLRAGDERRAWESFAEATRALNQLDERPVAHAGVAGALTLFAAEQVDVDVLRADGIRRRYSGGPSGAVTESDVAEQDAAPEPATPVDIPVDDETCPAVGASRAVHAVSRTVVRPLTVGASVVGELRVRYPYPRVAGHREQLAMAAFADALGAALHDAATHQQLQVLSARSSHAAVHDQLTGLANRAALLAEGDATLRMLERGHPVGLLVLDIDNFREVNETLGHGAGDQLLQILADRLRAQAHPQELLGRLGGDEFAVLTPVLHTLSEASAGDDGAALRAAAVRRAREIAERLAEPTDVCGVRLAVEASVGVAVAPVCGADMAELLRRADIAMYLAKHGGVGVAAYDDARDAASTDELALLAELREALGAGDQLVLALQPAVDLETGQPTGVEALIRWRHPRRGPLMPADFIRAVEGSELLRPFTRHVVDRSLAVAAEWTAEGLDVPISVNISARSLLDRRLPGDVLELLRRHRVPARLLVLEITETVVMSESGVVDEVLAELRGLGIQLSVDDFGTGYSSLAFLTRIPVHELKVDRSFVGRMVESAAAAAIVRTTVDLGRGLGLRVVAEGVETAAQRAALADLGCSSAQGYHFCRPVPSDVIVSELHSLAGKARTRVLPLRADDAAS